MKKESKIKITTKYATAIYEAAEADGDLKRVAEDLQKLREALADDGMIVKYLANPLWEIQDKKEALKVVAAKLKLAPESLNSLLVIADNNRFAELPDILDGFRRVYHEKHGIAEVRVETVKPLSKAQDEKLKANLKKFLKKEVLVNYEIKPEILGGLVISYGSDMIDDSIKGKLNRLETVMKGGQ